MRSNVPFPVLLEIFLTPLLWATWSLTVWQPEEFPQILCIGQHRAKRILLGSFT